jgi:polyisoprenoid-binding protein YceI
MNATGTINANQSDILLKMQHSIVAYLAGTMNKFNGKVEMKDDEVEKASFEFSLNSNDDITITHLHSKNNKLNLSDFPDIQENPIMSFKSTSFQKVNKHINFLKGDLTIKNVTKVVEFDTEFLGIKVYDGVQKALFEVTGEINRYDFNLAPIPTTNNRIFSSGKNIKLIANLEFDI